MSRRGDRSDMTGATTSLGAGTVDQQRLLEAARSGGQKEPGSRKDRPAAAARGGAERTRGGVSRARRAVPASPGGALLPNAGLHAGLRGPRPGDAPARLAGP